MSALLSSSGYHLLRPHCLPVTLPPRHSSPFPSRPLLAHHFVWNIISFYPFPLVLCNILRSQPSSLITPPPLPPPTRSSSSPSSPPSPCFIGCWWLLGGRALSSLIVCLSRFHWVFHSRPIHHPLPLPLPPTCVSTPFIVVASLIVVFSLSKRALSCQWHLLGHINIYIFIYIYIYISKYIYIHIYTLQTNKKMELNEVDWNKKKARERERERERENWSNDDVITLNVIQWVNARICI